MGGLVGKDTRGAGIVCRNMCGGEYWYMGQLFFVIFINDLPMHIDNVDLFADDTTSSASVDYTEI